MQAFYTGAIRISKQNVEIAQQSMAAFNRAGGMVEREAILLVLRDLIVLIVVVAFLLWAAYEITREDRR
jgi:hypothetical protein